MPIRAVLKDVATARSIFSLHLHTQLWHLRQNRDLFEAQHLLEVGTPIRLEQTITFKLKSLGLVHLDGNPALIAVGCIKPIFATILTDERFVIMFHFTFLDLVVGTFDNFRLWLNLLSMKVDRHGKTIAL